jgi:hypothetical protein
MDSMAGSGVHTRGRLFRRISVEKATVSEGTYTTPFLFLLNSLFSNWGNVAILAHPAPTHPLRT